MRYGTIPILVIVLWTMAPVWGLPVVHADDIVGYMTTIVPVDGQESVSVSVWYPAVGETTRVVYNFGRLTRTGGAFVNASPDSAAAPYAAVVYSHGYAGCSISSAYLCEALAAMGLIVVAPDHSDDIKACSLQSGFYREPFVVLKILFSALDLRDRLAEGDYDIDDFRYRLSQIKAVVDYLVAEGRDVRSPFFGLIDTEHIGAVGHSLGGFSVMVAAGALEVGIDFPIDAVVVMSGPGGDAFTCADMKRIGVPAMLMYGTREADKHRKGAGIREQYRCLAGPKFLMGLVGGEHLTFADGIFSDSSSYSRLKRKADARHEIISRYVTAFFSYYLSGDTGAQAILERAESGLDPYLHEF